MKIAMMTNNYKPFIGGVPVSVEFLSEGLRALGHEVTVFAPTYKEQQEEAHVVRYHTFLEGPAGGVAFPNPIDLRIEKEFKKQHFDLIHVHHPMLIGRTAVYLSKKYDIPLVFTYHTRYDQYLHYVPLVHMLEKNAREKGSESRMLTCIHEKIIPAYLRSFFRHCSHVFVPTEGLCGYLTGYHLMKEEDISVLPTGIRRESFHADEEAVAAVRELYDCKDMPLFLSVSRMAHEKNVSFLLESIRRFKEQYGKPFRVLLVGDGPNLADYQKLCDCYGLSEVVFTGKLPNQQLPAYYHAADAFLFASKTETQGIVILEAFAGGTPVLAVRASGVSDLVVSGENGFLVEEDTVCFSEQLIKLADDWAYSYQKQDSGEGECRLRRLGRGASETAEAYREEEIAKRAQMQYLQILEKRNTAGMLRPA